VATAATPVHRVPTTEDYGADAPLVWRGAIARALEPPKDALRTRRPASPSSHLDLPATETMGGTAGVP